ncbi:hypothetical protein SLS53_001209 [Cytospora paraplurivora]|uniref:Uncharacterized protein n=1 Tax=Cytospora paraplurivora TaxID=2898453 RepID=A0AAN9UJF3_9PEZI
MVLSEQSTRPEQFIDIQHGSASLKLVLKRTRGTMIKTTYEWLDLILNEDKVLSMPRKAPL